MLIDCMEVGQWRWVSGGVLCFLWPAAKLWESIICIRFVLLLIQFGKRTHVGIITATTVRGHPESRGVRSFDGARARRSPANHATLLSSLAPSMGSCLNGETSTAFANFNHVSCSLLIEGTWSVYTSLSRSWVRSYLSRWSGRDLAARKEVIYCPLSHSASE